MPYHMSGAPTLASYPAPTPALHPTTAPAHTSAHDKLVFTFEMCDDVLMSYQHFLFLINISPPNSVYQ